MAVPTSSQPNAHLGASASTASSPYLNQQVPDEKIALLAYAAGWRGHNVVIATAIALSESSGSNVVQQGQPGATTGWGLWQITPGDSSLLDPSVNAKAAYAKYRGAGYNFRPWTTYQDGAYQANMSRAQTAYKNAGIDFGLQYNPSGPSIWQQITGDQGLAGLGAYPSAVANAAGSVIDSVPKFLSFITSGATWVMFLKVLAGLLLVGVGAYLLVKG